MGREADMIFDLAKAIYAGDIDAAREALDDMRRAGIKSDLIMRARSAVHPMPETAPLAKAIALPAPGADPAQHFGGQKFKGWSVPA